MSSVDKDFYFYLKTHFTPSFIEVMKSFLYYGDDLFDKFSSVSLTSVRKTEQKLNESNSDSCKVFDSVLIEDQRALPLIAVYPSWHQTFFVAGCGIYCTGFWKTAISRRAELLYSFCDSGSSAFISAGWNGALLLTEHKKCVLLSYRDFSISSIEDSRINEKLKQVALTDNRGLLVTDDGSVYTFRIYPQVGDIEYLPGLNSVSNIACGKEHTLFLTVNGQVYSLGSGSRGQLGHGHCDAETEPKLIEALDGIHITQIAAGGWHSAAVSECEDLYTWGWNESGQLGRTSNHSKSDIVTEAEEICMLPKLVNFEKDVLVKSVSLGSRHSAALLEDNTVWTWGWNKYGQLGNYDGQSRDVPFLLPVPSSFKCYSIQCSSWGTMIVGVYETVN